MSLAQYPLKVRGLTWPVMKTHEFATTVGEAANFYTTRILNSQNPIWHWTMVYEYLKDNPADLVAALSPHTDYRYLEGFLLSLQGQFAEFLLDDLYDDTYGMRSNTGGSATNPSSIKTTNYPNYEFYYAAGSYLVDNNATPHLQKCVVSGQSGTTVPTFSTSGGNTTFGKAVFTDQGVFNGANAGGLSIVTDTSGGITAAVVGGSAGTGFTVGDQLAVTGGGGSGAVLQVASLSGSAIASFTIVTPGTGYTTTTGAALVVLTGAGSGSPTANITVAPVKYSPLQRTMGGQFSEDITDQNTGVYAGAVWDNAVLKTQGTDYNIIGPGFSVSGSSYEGLAVQWINNPTGPVTALGQFFFRVCLESDQQDIEQFLQNLWTIGGTSSKNGSGMLKLVSSRAAQV